MIESNGADRGLEFLSGDARVRLMVVGDLMADKYIWGDGLRLSSEAPVPVVHVQEEHYQLGGAANVAKNAQMLGADVILCGLVGYDDAAHYFRQAVYDAGIESGGIFPTEARPTTLKVRVMSQHYHQQLVRFDYESTNPLTDQEKAILQGYIESYLTEIDALVLSDYKKGIFSDFDFARDILHLADEHDVMTIVDSKSARLNAFGRASLLITSHQGAREQVYVETGERVEDVEALGKFLIDQLSGGALMIVKDERGVYLFNNGEHPEYLPAQHQEVYDITGVEDTISSVAAVTLAAGGDVHTACQMAVCAAGIVVGKVGSAHVTPEELNHCYASVG